MAVDDVVHRNILRYMHGGVLTIGMAGEVIACNPNAEEILGIPQAELRTLPLAELFLSDRRNDDFYQAILDAIYDRRRSHSSEVRYYAGERVRDLLLTSSFLWDDAHRPPLKVGVICVFADVTDLRRTQDALAEANRGLERRVNERTSELSALNVRLREEVMERRRAQRQLEDLAMLDALTGLANRRAFEGAVGRILAKGGTAGALSVLFCDLDGFKPINDLHGHARGDWLLRQVARRLQNCVGIGDTLARLGGDEFAVALAGETAARRAGEVAERVLAALAGPFVDTDGRSFRVGMSIGVADCEDGDGERALRAADAALYAVKRAGKGGWRRAASGLAA